LAHAEDPDAGCGNGPPDAAPAAGDDQLIRTAARLTRDLGSARPRLYWADLLLSVGIGYGALALAILAGPLGAKLAAGTVSVLALYRALTFIHELTHLKPGAVPGFRTGWNLLVGVPMLVPSFMYEGMHNLHHARTRYGTAEDPEYLSLALMKPWTVALFLLASAPVALLLRYAVLAPLSTLAPPLRPMVVERYSALAVDPAFRRKSPEGKARQDWLLWEAAACLWPWALVTIGFWATGAFVTFVLVTSGVAVLNQLCILVAHLRENEGEPISIAEQYLDSVNVPPHSLLPALWRLWGCATTRWGRRIGGLRLPPPELPGDERAADPPLWRHRPRYRSVSRNSIRRFRDSASGESPGSSGWLSPKAAAATWLAGSPSPISSCATAMARAAESSQLLA
jgi:hypothetical protein